MNNRIWNLIGIAIMAVVIGLTLFQLTTPVVKADGCPTNPDPYCDCRLVDSISVTNGDRTILYCTYSCSCPSPGGGEPFVIEKTFEYYP